jgi:allantoinase
LIGGGLAIEGERIVAVGVESGLPPARRTIDAQGHYVVPGFIDAHVHLGPGGINWPPTAKDFRTESRAAAYGGVTTALVFLFSLDSYLPVLDDLIRWGEDNSVIDFAYQAGINSAAQIAEIRPWSSAGSPRSNISLPPIVTGAAVQLRQWIPACSFNPFE